MSKLTKQEAEDLAKAIELSVFSQVYTSNLGSPTQIQKTVTTSWTQIFFDMFLKTLTKAKETAPNHLVLISRNLYQTLKSAMIKYLQDYQILLSCKGSSASRIFKLKKGIEELLSMQHFLAYNFNGMETTKDLLAEYINFKWLNHKAIGLKMRAYIP
ncbi:unnamed protein product [Allacma fusca]|uniref:Uncharacterized protein n=1 Tax=Allacma fusca TaxID=39272 RepID=A0A8J2PSQ0_9HEXA|nr:unnamed protein product [Allacma fusca]